MLVAIMLISAMAAIIVLGLCRDGFLADDDLFSNDSKHMADRM